MESIPKMRRRDFVKAIMAASISAKAMLGQQSKTAVTPSVPPAAPPAAPTAPGPVPWMRGLNEVKPLPMTPLVPDAVAQPHTMFFSDHQRATLRRLGDLLMPAAKGFPGATDAGTPEFLDFLIGVSPPDRQQFYKSSLDRLDGEAKQHFGVAFAATNKAQADELIRPWLKPWMGDNPPPLTYAHFINIAHSEIRTATINSQVWSDAAKAAGKQETGRGLYWFPVEPDLHHETVSAIHQAVANKRRS